MWATGKEYPTSPKPGQFLVPLANLGVLPGVLAHARGGPRGSPPLLIWACSRVFLRTPAGVQGGRPLANRVGNVSARLGDQAPTLWEAFDNWLRRATSVISDSVAALNAINVFPVPDADTGSNLKLTLTGISQAVGQARAGQPGLSRPSSDLVCPRQLWGHRRRNVR